MESAWESDVQPAPDLSAFPPRSAFANLDSLDSQHPRGRQIVPGGVSREVSDVERVPVEVAANPAPPEERCARAISGAEDVAAVGFQPNVTGIEHGALPGVWKPVHDRVLPGAEDLKAEV